MATQGTMDSQLEDTTAAEHTRARKLPLRMVLKLLTGSTVLSFILFKLINYAATHYFIMPMRISYWIIFAISFAATLAILISKQRPWLLMIPFSIAYVVLEFYNITLEKSLIIDQYRFVLHWVIMLITEALPSLIALIVGWKLLISKKSDSISNKENFEYDIRKQANLLLNSNEFLTIFNTAFPADQNEIEPPLRSFPHIILSIRERGIRASKSASRFLSLTLLLGGVFSVILVLLGIILIDDTIIGKGKYIVELANYTSSLRSMLVSGAIHWTDEEGLKKVEAAVLPLSSILKELDIVDKISCLDVEYSIEQFKDDKSIGAVQKIRDALSSKTKKCETDNEKSAKRLKSTISYTLLNIENIIDARTGKQNEYNRLKSSLDRIDSLMKIYSDKPNEDRLTELLKRLSVGLIIASFFLAITRYSGELYRQHRQQYLLALDQELWLRKVYIAFKCSERNTDQRKDVLMTLLKIDLNYTGGINTKEVINSSEAGSAKEDLLKTLIDAVSEKIKKL